MIATNIQQALIIQRPDDIIVKVINNKWAIVKAAFDNGEFEKEQICFLSNGTIYFYPTLLKDFKDWFKYIMRFGGYNLDKKYRQNLTQAYLITI